MSMIKAVIFDLNGIFLQNPKLGDRVKNIFKMPAHEYAVKFEKEERVSEGMVNFAKQLRQKGVKVFILSNTIREVAEYYGQSPWMRELADKIYFSYQTGFKKPDKEAWENVLRDNGLQPGECVYFDDEERNLKACESLGIKSFLFTDEESLQKKFKELL